VHKIIIIVMATKPNVEVMVKAIKVRHLEICSGWRQFRPPPKKGIRQNMFLKSLAGKKILQDFCN